MMADDPSPSLAMRTGRRRFAYLALGWFFVVLGGIGAILPVIPTTPFLLLALWAFARSSRRAHDWLYNHPVVGPRLQEFSTYRVIPRSVKIIAIGAMSISLAGAIYEGLPWGILCAIALLMATGSGYILRCPSRRPVGAADDA